MPILTRAHFPLRLFTPVLGLVLLVPVNAAAHDPDKKTDYGHGGSLDAREHGREHGYRDGYHHGQDDRDRNLGFEYQGKDYERGDIGYQSYMGSKGQYKKGYRDGYKLGYEDGYRGNAGSFGQIYGNPNYPDNGSRPARDNTNDDIWAPNTDHSRDEVYSSRGWDVHDVAYDFGYKDGVYYAQRDMSNHHSANAEETKGYKDADHGYSHSYNKDEYKRYYREGFLRGYNDEYRRR